MDPSIKQWEDEAKERQKDKINQLYEQIHLIYKRYVDRGVWYDYKKKKR